MSIHSIHSDDILERWRAFQDEINALGFSVLRGEPMPLPNNLPGKLPELREVGRTIYSSEEISDWAHKYGHALLNLPCEGMTDVLITLMAEWFLYGYHMALEQESIQELERISKL